MMLRDSKGLLKDSKGFLMGLLKGLLKGFQMDSEGFGWDSKKDSKWIIKGF